jgi:hypothetical protein
MTRVINAVIRFLGLGGNAASATRAPLDYDQMVFLDAEDLAEAGIKEATYNVSCSGVSYDIYSPDSPEPIAGSTNPEQGAFFGQVPGPS